MSETTQADTNTSASLKDVPLDPGLFKPSPDEAAFFKQQTGIQDDEELKQHVVAVQKEAWEVVQYMCIRDFSFTKLVITYLPAYKELLAIGKEKPDAIYLELACCFGNDVRKAIADGFPKENIVASDIQQEFWDLGHKLFRTTPETYTVPFIQADLLSPASITPRAPFYEPPTTARPDLQTLTSLTQLQGHVSAIHVSAFFHVFPEEGQRTAARAIATLLSPEPGSMIFGYHAGAPVAGVRPYPNLRGEYIYCDTPETWTALWDGVIFEKGKVEVTAVLHEIDRPDVARAMGAGPNITKVHILGWCIKRL